MTAVYPDMTETNLYRNADFTVGEEKESYLTPEEVADFEYDAQKDATKAGAKKEREAADISVSAVLKTTPTIIKKLQRVYSNKSYEKALRHVSQESRDSDIAALEEVIEMATKLKEKIKAVD